MPRCRVMELSLTIVTYCLFIIDLDLVSDGFLQKHRPEEMVLILDGYIIINVFHKENIIKFCFI